LLSFLTYQSSWNDLSPKFLQKKECRLKITVTHYIIIFKKTHNKIKNTHTFTMFLDSKTTPKTSINCPMKIKLLDFVTFIMPLQCVVFRCSYPSTTFSFIFTFECSTNDVMFLYVKHDNGYLLLLYFIQLMKQKIYRMNKSINTDQVQNKKPFKKITVTITYQSTSFIWWHLIVLHPLF
jgi:hypothetical protein